MYGIDVLTKQIWHICQNMKNIAEKNDVIAEYPHLIDLTDLAPHSEPFKIIGAYNTKLNGYYAHLQDRKNWIAIDKYESLYAVIALHFQPMLLPEQEPVKKSILPFRNGKSKDINSFEIVSPFKQFISSQK